MTPLAMVHGPGHLAATLAEAARTDTPLRRRFQVMHHLVAHARLDAAEAAIDRLEAEAAAVRGLAARLATYRAHVAALRALGIGQAVAGLGALGEALLEPDRPVLAGRRPSRTLVVVFATQYNNFDMALAVLHCFLAALPVSVLYLKDTGPAHYLAGAPGMAADFGGLVARIGALAAEHGWRDIRVAGYSSSGYPALLAAHRLGARRFLGLSVRTDLSADAALPPGRLLTAAARAAIPPGLLGDLRPLLAARRAPAEVRLLHSTASPLDGRHADRLAGLPGVEVIAVPGASHCVSVDLVADGRWPALLGWLAGEA